MILTCPACATSYFIPDDAVGAQGRKVRCQACGEVWRATPDEPLELTLAPDAPAAAPSTIQASEPEREAASLAETPAPELPRAFRARAERRKKVRRAAAHGVVWAGLAAILIGLVVAALVFRVQIVRAFPRAASAYAAIGAPVNLVGLDFEALTAKSAPNRPGMVLASGAVRNVRDAEIVTPPIRVALLDAQGAEIGVRIVRIDGPPVLPGKVQGFAVLIPDPGGHGAGIDVDFAPAPPAPGKTASAKPAGDAEALRGPSAAPPSGEAAAHGLRSATAPGADAPRAAPIEARPTDAARDPAARDRASGGKAAVDKRPGQAVSASHHG